MATEVFDGWADVPALNTVRVPAVALVGGIMNNNLVARGGYRTSIEVKVSVEVGVCGEFGLASGGYDNIDGDVSLRHDAVPLGGREIGITG